MSKKWDKLNKELDDALEVEFGTVQSVFENAKLVLREHLLANKEQVAKDLQEMREKSSSGRDLTIEEAAANLADPNICKTDNWIAGAKWQQERSYSEEDLISFAHFYFKEEFNSTMQTSKSTDEILQDWFEQFKKK
jgi:hypothetical protein